jgi:AcrR family transcriptional regulator
MKSLPTSPKRQAGKRQPTRTNDPQRTMANILTVARKEFSEKGLAGARIDQIAAETQTSKRMIYYYFGSKEGLYLKVLETAYQGVRTQEADLHLEDLPPEEALRKLVGSTFDHHHRNQDYIRLVMNENIERGAYLQQSKTIQDMNVPAIQSIQKLIDRGVAAGVFRTDLDAIDLHSTISALAFFNVSNRHTFSTIFKRDTHAGEGLVQRRANIIDVVTRYVRR